MSSRIAFADRAMHGDRARARIGAQTAQHLVAVEVGQLQVDEDEIGSQRERALDAGGAGLFGDDRQTADARDELLDEQDVDGVVLDVEDRAAALDAGVP